MDNVCITPSAVLSAAHGVQAVGDALESPLQELRSAARISAQPGFQVEAAIATCGASMAEALAGTAKMTGYLGDAVAASATDYMRLEERHIALVKSILGGAGDRS